MTQPPPIPRCCPTCHFRVCKCLTFMHELAAIRRGEHPAWEGDRVRNCTAFLKRMSPNTALANVTEDNAEDVSEETGLSPCFIGLAVRILRGESTHF